MTRAVQGAVRGTEKNERGPTHRGINWRGKWACVDGPNIMERVVFGV